MYLYNDESLVEQEALRHCFSLQIQNECVIEWHVVSVPAEDYEVVPKDDSRVSVPCSRPLTFGLSVAIIVRSNT